MPLFRYSSQNWAVRAACLVGVGAGAALHHPAGSTSLPPTKMKEQISAALLLRSAVGLRAGCAALSVPQENPGTGPVSQKRQREGEERVVNNGIIKIYLLQIQLSPCPGGLVAYLNLEVS